MTARDGDTGLRPATALRPFHLNKYETRLDRDGIVEAGPGVNR